jgi:predicted transcriptional regulator
MKSILSGRRFGKPISLVSGLARSGTSMLMLMLKEAGLPIVCDHLRTADEDNPKGYHELERVKELDKTEEKSWLKNHRGEVIKIISFLLQDLPDNLNYKVIFMRRNLNEVLRSQNKMLERNGNAGTDASDEKMHKNYDMHLRKVYYRLNRAPNFKVLYMDYPNVVANPRHEAERISAFLGGDLDAEKMAGAVDSGLYRNRHSKPGNAK